MSRDSLRIVSSTSWNNDTYNYRTTISIDTTQHLYSLQKPSSPLYPQLTFIFYVIRSYLSDNPTYPKLIKDYDTSQSFDHQFEDLESKSLLPRMISKLNIPFPMETRSVDDTISMISNVVDRVSRMRDVKKSKHHVCVTIERQLTVPLHGYASLARNNGERELWLRIDNQRKSVMDVLKKVRFDSNTIGGGYKTKMVCVICMSEFGIGCEVTGLPCCHLFHGHCIESWLLKSYTCPLCRFKLPS